MALGKSRINLKKFKKNKRKRLSTTDIKNMEIKRLLELAEKTKDPKLAQFVRNEVSRRKKEAS